MIPNLVSEFATVRSAPAIGTLDGSAANGAGPPVEHRAAELAASPRKRADELGRFGRAAPAHAFRRFPHHRVDPGADGLPLARRIVGRHARDLCLGAGVGARLLQASALLCLGDGALVPAPATHRLGVLPAGGDQCRHRPHRHLEARRTVRESRGATAVGTAADVHALLQFHGVQLQRQHDPAVDLAMDRLCIRALARDALDRGGRGIWRSCRCRSPVEILFDPAADLLLRREPRAPAMSVATTPRRLPMSRLPRPPRCSRRTPGGHSSTTCRR